MTGRLAGKVAFITGAARGQGRAHPDAVLWLASDESRNVTAAGISVDQGCTEY